MDCAIVGVGFTSASANLRGPHAGGVPDASTRGIVLAVGSTLGVELGPTWVDRVHSLGWAWNPVLVELGICVAT